MEITVLLENESKGKGLSEAHGLSVWVREGETRLLFDTGPDDSFIGNASALGVDLSSVTTVALSHNHWDHTGGVMSLMARLDRPMMLYTGKGFFSDKYAQEAGDLRKLSHLEKQALIESDALPNEVDAAPRSLGGRLYLLGGWDMPYPFEVANERFVIEKNGGWTTDPFDDEIVLVYEGDAELALLSGCAHPGIAGMVKKAVKVFNKPVHTLLGGVHLMGAGEKRVKQTAEVLSELGVKTLGLAHCSGEKIGEVWAKKYGAVAGFHGGDRVVVEVL